MSALKAAVLVDSSVIIVNMFFYFCNKALMLNDLGESVMCDKDSLFPCELT